MAILSVRARPAQHSRITLTITELAPRGTAKITWEPDLRPRCPHCGRPLAIHQYRERTVLALSGAKITTVSITYRCAGRDCPAVMEKAKKNPGLARPCVTFTVIPSQIIPRKRVLSGPALLAAALEKAGFKPGSFLRSDDCDPVSNFGIFIDLNRHAAEEELRRWRIRHLKDPLKAFIRMREGSAARRGGVFRQGRNGVLYRGAAFGPLGADGPQGGATALAGRSGRGPPE